MLAARFKPQCMQMGWKIGYRRVFHLDRVFSLRTYLSFAHGGDTVRFCLQLSLPTDLVCAKSSAMLSRQTMRGALTMSENIVYLSI